MCKRQMRKSIVPEDGKMEWQDFCKYPPLPAWGHEYLYSWYEKIYDSRDLIICAEGDSTTYEGYWNQGGERRIMIAKLLDRAGITNYTVKNCGYGGATTGHWVGSWLEDGLQELKGLECTKERYPWGTLDLDMTYQPDLLIWSYGINDARADLYPGETVLQKLDRLERNLREGLARIRGSEPVNGRPCYHKNADELAVILCTPVMTCSFSPGNAMELWTKYVRRIIQMACRDYQCAFYDISMRHYDHAFSLKWSVSTDISEYDGTHPRPACNADFISGLQELLVPVCLWR